MRDTNNGKFEYIGFTHPLCDHSFAEYMNRHRVMPDGSLRGSSNWWAGWDRHISLDCMLRHVMDLRCLEAGLGVYKERVDGKEITHVLQDGEVPEEGWEEVTEEDCCSAIRFNSDAYKLNLLQGLR